LSVDPVESEPPYLYVRGNPVNWVDPSGLIYCDPVTGYCPEIDRYLCSHTPGPYDSRKAPCVVNPENVNIGNAPSSSPVPAPAIPIRPTDETWKFIQDDPDLTYWLFDELKEGFQNPDVNLVRVHITYLGIHGRNPAEYALGGLMWRALVRDKARYDFKHKIREEMRTTILFRRNDGRPLWSEYSVPGNIFFGYIGSYVGFAGWGTHAGAGYAEAADPAHKPIRNVCDRLYLNPQWWGSLFDDPLDYQAIELGINLWRKYGQSLSLHQLKTEIENNYSKLSSPPAMPPLQSGTGEIPVYGWRNPRGDWPYGVGRFNGPNAEKYWPPDFNDPDFYGLGGD
jgi:hypothetical protein